MSIKRWFIAVFVMTMVGFTSAIAETLHFDVVTGRGQAAAANPSEAFIFIRISNPDGTPNDSIRLETRQDPKGGLELKGSQWSFATLLVPQGYQGRVQASQRDIFGNAKSTQFDISGQLRIIQMGHIDHGIYWLRIIPMYGAPGSVKSRLNWVSGDYLFRVSYNDGQNQGDALGRFTIR